MPLDEARQDRRCADRQDAYRPENGVVSTEAIAKEVGFQYLREVFPDDDHLRPLAASLSDGVWHVTGSYPPGYIDNVAHILICQSNGRVLGLWHDQ